MKKQIATKRVIAVRRDMIRVIDRMSDLHNALIATRLGIINEDEMIRYMNRHEPQIPPTVVIVEEKGCCVIS